MRQSKLKIFSIFQRFYEHRFGKRGQTWNEISNSNRNTMQISHCHQSLPKIQDIKNDFSHLSDLGILEIQIPRNKSTHWTSIQLPAILNNCKWDVNHVVAVASCHDLLQREILTFTSVNYDHGTSTISNILVKLYSVKLLIFLFQFILHYRNQNYGYN